LDIYTVQASEQIEMLNIVNTTHQLLGHSESKLLGNDIITHVI
jgi:hypothetical protein